MTVINDTEADSATKHCDSHTLRALTQSPSTLWRPHVHVVLPSSPCQQPWPLRPELSMHSRSTRRTTLRLSLLLPRSRLLPTRQADAHQASRKKTKSTVGSSHILPSRCLRRRPRLAVHILCCTRPSIPGFPSGIAPDVGGLHVLGVRLLYPSRQFFKRELKLTLILTEPASSTIGSKIDPLHQAPCHLLRQSSAHQVYSQLCVTFSVPSVTPRFPRVEGRPRAPIARLPLRLEDTVSTVSSSESLLAHCPFQHWVPPQLSSTRLGMPCTATFVHSRRSRHPSAPA